MVHAAFIASAIIVIGIIILIRRWIKNKRLPINNIILLVLFVLGIPFCAYAIFLWWFASGIGI